MNNSGIIGLGGFCVLLGAAIFLGGDPAVFFNWPSLIVVLGVLSCAGLMAFGVRNLLDGLLALRVLIVRVPDAALSLRQARVLRGLIPSAYAGGVLGMMIGVVQILAALDDSFVLAPAMAVASLTVLYSVMLAEGLLRPGAQHIESRCAERVKATGGSD